MITIQSETVIKLYLRIYIVFGVWCPKVSVEHTFCHRLHLVDFFCLTEYISYSTLLFLGDSTYLLKVIYSFLIGFLELALNSLRSLFLFTKNGHCFYRTRAKCIIIIPLIYLSLILFFIFEFYSIMTIRVIRIFADSVAPPKQLYFYSVRDLSTHVWSIPYILTHIFWKVSNITDNRIKEVLKYKYE